MGYAIMLGHFLRVNTLLLTQHFSASTFKCVIREISENLLLLCKFSCESYLLK